MRIDQNQIPFTYTKEVALNAVKICNEAEEGTYVAEPIDDSPNARYIVKCYDLDGNYLGNI